MTGAPPQEQESQNQDLRPPIDAPSGRGLKVGEPPREFSRYDGGWITFEYHPSLSGKVRVLREEASTMRDQLASLFGRSVLERVTVRVGRTPFEMEKLAPRGAGFPKYASGVAYSQLDLVLLTAAPRYPGEQLELAEVFRHELAHIALHDALGRDRVPRWFNEGFAVHVSGEAEVDRVQTLWTATLAGTLLPFAQLETSFPQDSTEASIAYAQAADLVRFLLRGGQEHRFRSLVQRIAKGQSFRSALSDAYSTDMYSLEAEWREDVARRYTFWPILLGGSSIWVFAIMLFVWGYVRRRRRARKKLDRWAREEAAEDARRQFAQALLQKGGPVRVVLGASPTTADSESSRLALSQTGEDGTARAESASKPPTAEGGEFKGAPPVPKIEHEGSWHTLH